MYEKQGKPIHFEWCYYAVTEIFGALKFISNVYAQTDILNPKVLQEKVLYGHCML